MKIYIDTNTFPASPALYADAEKTKALPRILPAVELQRGGFEVAFLGANQPQDIATVSLAATIEGTQTQVVAEIGRKSETEDAWQFDFALNSEALVAEVAKHGSARLRVGVIVEDDTERREWQLVAVVYPSASGEANLEQVESAKNFAELAEQAAKRAQEAQADVAGNAQLAESAKQTATQAANAAIEAADNAEISEHNAAESKGAAEQAKTAAESAKTAAEKAASDAQATLGNVYTKSQIDAALAERDSRIANAEENIGLNAQAIEHLDEAQTEEVQAREQADAALGERVDAVEPSKDSDWKDYMFARAKLTNSQANIELVKKAIVDSVALGDAETLPARMIEDWKNLYGYESFSGRKLDAEFWSAYFEAVVGWMANPTATEEWVVTKNGDGTYSANYPYFSSAPTKPIVNFAVVSAKGIDSYPAVFNAGLNVDVYFPNLTTASQFIARRQYAKNFIVPKFKVGYQFASLTVFENDAFAFTKSVETFTNGFINSTAGKVSMYSPKLTGGVRMFSSSKIVEFVGEFPVLTNGGGAFYNSTMKRFSAGLPSLKTNKYLSEGMFARSSLEEFDSSLPSLIDGEDMFLNSKLPAAEISKILDSLPSDPVGKGGTGVITFTGCPGAAELTQESASVAAATARGWTVEL